MNKPTLIVIVGPTAVGKTNVAIDLAKKLNCEILSADSRQFYREMSIGTAKPNIEEMDDVPHHFINNLSISEDYSAGKFETEALAKLEELYQKNKVAILVGGSGLFVNALCFGLDDIPSASAELRGELNSEYEEKGIEALQKKVAEIDPVFYQSVDIYNKQRLLRALEVYTVSGIPLSEFQKNNKINRPFTIAWIGLEMDRATLYERINNRVDLMLKIGLLEEVKSLSEYQNLNPLKTVGYQELYDAFNNNTPLSEAIEKIKQNSRRYAKRQLTWFKKNKEINWFNPNDLKNIYLELNRFKIK